MPPPTGVCALSQTAATQLPSQTAKPVGKMRQIYRDSMTNGHGPIVIRIAPVVLRGEKSAANKWCMELLDNKIHVIIGNFYCKQFFV